MGLRSFQQDPHRVPPEYARDEDWLEAHLPELVQQYPDKWIAVLGEKVVASGDNLDEVMKGVEAQSPDAMPVYWLVEGTPRVYPDLTAIS